MRLLTVLIDATDLLHVGRELFPVEIVLNGRLEYAAARCRDERNLVEDLGYRHGPREVRYASVGVFTAPISQHTIAGRIPNCRRQVG